MTKPEREERNDLRYVLRAVLKLEEAERISPRSTAQDERRIRKVAEARSRLFRAVTYAVSFREDESKWKSRLRASALKARGWSP